MAPHFERAAAALEPAVRLAKLNTDENSKTSLRLRIRSIPTMILFRNGEEVARQAGAMDSRAISNWVKAATANV
jgi:thioredoxin 2